MMELKLLGRLSFMDDLLSKTNNVLLLYLQTLRQEDLLVLLSF